MTKEKASWWMSRYCRLRDAIKYCKGRGVNLGQFVRPEDIIAQCCSCNTVKSWYRLQGGHYFGRGLGGGSGAYFDERNVYAQCCRCNAFLGGNFREYQDYMHDLYGPGITEELRIIHKSYSQPEPSVIGAYYEQQYGELVKGLNGS